MLSNASQLSNDGFPPFLPVSQSHDPLERARTDQHLLDTVLSNVEQGVLMFDADRRLVFYNDHYAAMYRLPRDFAKAGCTLRDVLDHCLRAGILVATDVEDYLAWLEEGLAELQLADFAGGRVDVLVQDPRRMTSAEAFESVFAFHNERYIKDLSFTVTASMFVWRSVFDAVGGFVNGVPEDKDWGMRARRQGFRIRFAPKSIVGHPARRTMPELKRKWRRLMLESGEGARREGTGQARFILRQWAALLAVAPHAFVALASKRLKGVRNRVLAIIGLAQIRAYRVAIAHKAVLGSFEE